MIKKLTLVFVLFLSTTFSFAESGREYFKFAKFNYDSKHYSKALEFINRAIAADPDYVNGLLLRAEINFQLSSFDEVIDDITQAFSIDENARKSMANFHLLRGDAYFKLNDINKAKQDIEYCLKLNPEIAKAHFLHGLILVNKKINFEALDAFDKAIKIDSDVSEYYYERAKLKKIHFKPLPETKTYNSILADIKLSIALNPDDYRPYKLRCEILKLDEHYNKQELIDELEDYIAFFPEQSVFYSERGLTRVLVDNYTQAVSDFTKAIQLNETDEANYRNRGLCFHNMRKYQLALNDYTKSIGLLVTKYQKSDNDEAIKKILAQTFNMRGMSNHLNGNTDLACDDYYNSAKLGSKPGLNNYRKLCHVYN